MHKTGPFFLFIFFVFFLIKKISSGLIKHYLSEASYLDTLDYRSREDPSVYM